MQKQNDDENKPPRKIQITFQKIWSEKEQDFRSKYILYDFKYTSTNK